MDLQVGNSEFFLACRCTVEMAFQCQWRLARWVNPIALRRAKIACNFGLSEYSRVKHYTGLLG